MYNAVSSDATEGEVDRDGQFESLELSLSGFDCMGVRWGTRKEVRRGAILLKFVEENREAGTVCIDSVLVTGVFSGATIKRLGLLIFECRATGDFAVGEWSALTVLSDGFRIGGLSPLLLVLLVVSTSSGVNRLVFRAGAEVGPHDCRQIA